MFTYIYEFYDYIEYILYTVLFLIWCTAIVFKLSQGMLHFLCLGYELFIQCIYELFAFTFWHIIYASMFDFMKICWGLPRTLGRKKFHFAIGGLTRLIHRARPVSPVVWWVCTTNNIRHVSNEKVMSQVFVYIFSPPSLPLQIEVSFQSSTT